MTPFLDFIAALLAWVYSIWENYAWAITALTLLIMVVTTPLTLKGTRSMMLMQQVQPEMKKLQQRYKDDRQRLNEELMKFYKENDISPLGGCLPLLIQLPVFFLLYDVLRGLTRRTPTLGFPLGFSGGQLATGHALTKVPTPVVPPSGPHCATPQATPGACFDPSYLKHSTALYQNLSHTNVMKALGVDLSQSLLGELGKGVLVLLPYILLVVIVGVTGWVQQKQIQGRTPTADMPQQQQALMKIMPYYLPAIAIFLPAGLVLYFAVSNLYRVGQQWFIGRHIYGPMAEGGKAKAVPAEPSPGGGGGSQGSGGRGGGAAGRPKKPGPKPTKGDAAASPDDAEPEAAAATPPARSTKSRAEARARDNGGNGGNGGGRKRTPARASDRAASGTTGKAGESSKSAPSKTAPSKSAPSKAAASDKAGASGRGRSDRASKASGGAGDGKPTQPILQPRARKNKKG
jgi:YidC/Oxa1 family membrane protein insertase